MAIGKFEEYAVPTVLTTVAGGAYGFAKSKINTADGAPSKDFVNYTATRLEKNDLKLLKSGLELSEILEPVVSDGFVSEQEVKNLKYDHDKVFDFANKKLDKSIDNVAKKELAQEKKLFSFVKKHADAFGITPAKGQTKNAAVKAFIANNDRVAIMEKFLPESTASILLDTDHISFVKGAFAEAFDKDAKKFKSGEEVKDVVKLLKASARDFHLNAAGKMAALCGAATLLVVGVADGISKLISRK